jgi:hypothetical protein
LLSVAIFTNLQKDFKKIMNENKPFFEQVNLNFILLTTIPAWILLGRNSLSSVELRPI